MNKLNKDQEAELNEWINTGEIDKFLVDKEPTERMDAKFYQMLEENRPSEKKQWSFTWLYKIALPMLLLVLTFYVGQQFGSSELEKIDQKDFATQLLSTENVGDKISLVSNTKIEENSDQKVIEALMFSLSNDESVNVRLACINTLYDYAYLPKVRTGLIQAISNQQSPVVLANLAEAINASGKKLSKEEFMELINKDLPPPIKKSINDSLIKI